MFEVVLRGGLFADDAASAVGDEGSLLFGRQLVFRHDLETGARVRGEAREHVLRLFVDAAEPLHDHDVLYAGYPRDLVAV